MNDAYENVVSVEEVGNDPGASVCVADLGDAVEETKEWSWDPWVLDNLLQPGWY